jgi:hypothetical protein
MYWSNQEIDYTLYPPCCPDCYELKWLDYDWETGLGYCIFCGWYPDNGDVTVSSSEAGEG